MGQIRSDLLKKAFATWRLPVFPLAPRFTTICSGLRKNHARLVGFSFFHILRLSFFSFSYPFAAVIDLLLGLLPIQKILRKHHRDWQILPWSSPL